MLRLPHPHPCQARSRYAWLFLVGLAWLGLLQSFLAIRLQFSQSRINLAKSTVSWQIGFLSSFLARPDISYSISYLPFVLLVFSRLGLACLFKTGSCLSLQDWVLLVFSRLGLACLGQALSGLSWLDLALPISWLMASLSWLGLILYLYSLSFCLDLCWVLSQFLGQLQ